LGVNEEHKSTPDVIAPGGGGDDQARQTITDSAIQHTVDLSADLIWDGEDGYVVVLEHGHVRTLALRSKAFKRWLISKMLAHGVKTPSSHQQWQAILDVLESRAAEGGTKPTPSIRVAAQAAEVATDGSVVVPAALYVDLGDEGWHCVRITAEGWQLIPHPGAGPYFYRPPRMAGLPTPERGRSVADLWEFFNLEGGDRMLFLAYLVQIMRAKGPYPILTVHGVQGSTKTTLVSGAKALSDPGLSSPETPAVTSPRRPPRDEDDVISAARNNRVVAFDNVSYIDQWLADALCRLATGAELGGRRKYTDFDEAVFTACRPIMLNGIPDVVGQSDLADRCIKIEVRRPAERLAEAVFWHRFEHAWPALFGVVLDLVSATLRHWVVAGERVPIDADVRMRDYARIGEALAIELGWRPGDFTRLYAENQRGAAAEIAQNDTVYAPLCTVLEAQGGEWSGQLQELLKLLSDALPADTASQDLRRSKEWPKTPRALGGRLRRLTPALISAGVTVEEGGRSNGKIGWQISSNVHCQRELPAAAGGAE
jgi:hypothetical protein